MGKLIAIYTPKGGVGKTTTATNLALWLANPLSDSPRAGTAERSAIEEIFIEQERHPRSRVCLVDLDGSRNAFSTIGPKEEDGRVINPSLTLKDYFEDKASIEEVLLESPYSRNLGAGGGNIPSGEVWVIPSDLSLTSASWLADFRTPTFQRKVDLFCDELRSRFDYVVFDFPYIANLEHLNHGIMRQVDGAIMIMSSIAAKEQEAIIKAREDAQALYGDAAPEKVLGLVMCRIDTGHREPGQAIEDSPTPEIKAFRQLFEDAGQFFFIVAHSKILENAEAGSMPVYVYQMMSVPSRKYLRVAIAIKQRLGGLA